MMLDCDLLVGRDPAVGMMQQPPALAARLARVGLGGGAVASLRALLFDAQSGNDEALQVASAQGWIPVFGVDLRDPLGAESEIDRAASLGVRLLRLAPGRQGIPGTAPRLRTLAERAVSLGLTLLVEGSTTAVGPALMGIDAHVVFLDQSFYELGEFVMLARDEPGFHISTRVMGSPGAWELLVERLGAERLVLGTRAGWSEEAAVLERLRVTHLSEEQRHLVCTGNLRRLAAGPR